MSRRSRARRSITSRARTTQITRRPPPNNTIIIVGGIHCHSHPYIASGVPGGSVSPKTRMASLAYSIVRYPCVGGDARSIVQAPETSVASVASVAASCNGVGLGSECRTGRSAVRPSCAREEGGARREKRAVAALQLLRRFRTVIIDHTVSVATRYPGITAQSKRPCRGRWCAERRLTSAAAR